MASIADIMQLCRLCLVKEQVNVPIFEDQDDAGQIFVKITACLPVKISKEDRLPKKICDGCQYKLDLLYQFCNTTTNAEKQLLSWLTAAGPDTNENNTKSTDESNSVSKFKVNLKTEPNNESCDSLSIETKSYILQQQQLPYESDEFPFQEDDFEEQTTTSADAPAIIKDVEQPPSKKRRTAAPTLLQEPPDESDEDIEYATVEEPEKTEEESEDDTLVEPSLIEVLNVQDEQPGPSGIGKTEAQYEEVIVETEHESSLMASYQCEVCSQIFADRKEFLEHHMSQFGSTFSCCRCDESFKNSTELYQHYESHKNENEIIITGTNSDINEEIIEDEEEDVDVLQYSEHVEAVMNIPGSNAIESTNELLYILDDSQCVNEVVIDEAGQVTKSTQSANSKSENFTIVQVDHGYIIPSVFKGQLEAKRRYKKRESTEMFIEDEDTKATNTLVKMEPSTSKMYNTSPKLKVPHQKRRHEVPDFSATTYQLLNPTEDVDMPHYKCLRCEQLFINKFVFFRHIEKGKCYVNSCDVCTAVFDKNSEFYEHYVTEHTERAICNFCFRTFMYEKNVKEHMLRHLDQFRHRCEECNKGFYTVREYRNHYKNRHMGIRHKCDECGRSFADEYYFKRHLATHGFKHNSTQIQQ